MNRLLTILLASIFAADAHAATTTAPAQWGEARDGLSAALRVETAPAVGGRFLAVCALRNEGTAPVKTADAFAWMLIVQSRELTFYTGKIPLASQKNWPAELKAGQTAELTIDLSTTNAFALKPGTRVIDGYPAPAAGAPAPKPAGTVSDILPNATIRARWTLVLPGRNPTLILTSNPLTLDVAPPDPTKLTPAQRAAITADLIAQFNRDESAAKSAHDRAVKIGPRILPNLLSAAQNRDAPYFARIWLTTTLIDIGDASAVPTLLKLLANDDASTKNVIAYHGPKLKNRELNDALLAAAQSDGSIAAWSVRGFASFASAFPDKLIDIALASKDERARAEVAGALARRTDDTSRGRLFALFKDQSQTVRASAARAILAASIKSQQSIGSMIDALDTPGDAARQSICAALVELTGQTWPYDPKASGTDKQAVIKTWKKWWSESSKDFQP